MPNIPFAPRADLPPEAILRQAGTIFATFDSRTQDSGNVSWGVEASGRRWFVKTAGDPADVAPLLRHQERVALLENAQALARSVTHPALVPLHGTASSAWGPMLVYDWAPGELVHAPAAQRGDPKSVFRRFRALPVSELEAAIDTILDAHRALCAKGWIACDFYDGGIIYDFESRRLRLVDLDMYHLGPFTNEIGRMFGSTRFMAPEEFERGALIDERTTVFTLGRAMSEFLGDGTLDRAAFRGSESQYRAMLTACAPDRRARYQSVAELAEAWQG
jgi:serine/threonine-protein kinase